MDMPTSAPDWSGHRGEAPAGRLDSGLVRVGLHLLLAALPLLAISAHVFGLVTMQVSAAILVIPLATAVIGMTVFAPHAGDRVLAHGFIWGIVACAIYDIFRLDTVYMLGWWADFIPTMGTWITGAPEDKLGGAIVGYLWRYVGDGGGIGITFFVLGSAVGLHRRPRTTVVLVAVGFAVFPVWAGLIATVAFATHGQHMMFPLTPTTVTLSLIGHLIFGLILGLGFWRSRAVQQHWPWEPVTGEQPVPGRRALAAVRAHMGSHALRAPREPRSGLPPGLPQPALRQSAFPQRGLPQSTFPSPAFPQPAVPSPSAPPSISGPLPTTSQVPGTPPSGQSLDPQTWELWQRQLQTTVRGRRTHRSARSHRTRSR